MSITNSMAWAIGEEHSGRFSVRRVVWGRLLARYEKRPRERIIKVKIVEWPPTPRKL
jgi:hypothetical protein